MRKDINRRRNPKPFKQQLMEVWAMFLAEIIQPFFKDNSIYLRFTRRLRFFGKVKTMQNQSKKQVSHG